MTSQQNLCTCVLSEGVWQFESQESVYLSDAPVTSLLCVGRDMWVACGKQVHVIGMTSSHGDTAHGDITLVSEVIPMQTLLS